MSNVPTPIVTMPRCQQKKYSCICRRRRGRRRHGRRGRGRLRRGVVVGRAVWRRRCRRRRRRSTVGVEVSAGRSLESAPGCLFLPFRLSLHCFVRLHGRAGRRFAVVRSTATTWLCRLSPTPSAASAPPLCVGSFPHFFRRLSLSIYIRRHDVFR